MDGSYRPTVGTREAKVELVLNRIDATITRDPAQWQAWPGGWRGEIGTALVDAVFSARARYTTEHGKGVKPLVDAWRAGAGGATSSLRALIEQIDSLEVAGWAERFGSRQHAPRRASTAPEGPLKAAAVREVAGNLGRIRIDTAADITDGNVGAAKAAMRSVSGIGFATTNYFLILLGRPGVKPDVMIHAFLTEATGDRLSNREAEQVLTDVAAHIPNVALHELDHAIWAYQRNQRS